jgi:TPP-dependent 2-oxoacid decarboxylase
MTNNRCLCYLRGRETIRLPKKKLIEIGRVMKEHESPTLGQYLITRLEQMGVRHVFGVPGDYVLSFCKQIEESSLEFINPCNELNGGYAADAYARINGVGCLVTTYGVGGLSAVNAVAGAYAEHIPLIIISGSPSTRDWSQGSELHLTVAAEVLIDPQKAPEIIDAVFQKCLLNRRPVYLEIPADLVSHPCPAPGEFVPPVPRPSDPAALAEAVSQAATMLTRAEAPVILTGALLHRHGLQLPCQKLIAKTDYPFASTLEAKTVIPEENPRCLGVYMGRFSRDYIREQVEGAGAVLCLGTFINDMNMGGLPPRIERKKTIYVGIDHVRVAEQIFTGVGLADFIDKLTEVLPPGKTESREMLHTSQTSRHSRVEEYVSKPETRITVDRMFHRLSHFLSSDDIYIGEVGVSLFALAESYLPQRVTALSQPFYMSIGYTVGATLGACLAGEGRRVITVVGDGSFQFTAQEISTIIRLGLNPVILLLNNDGYLVERLMVDGKFNDIAPWQYHQLPPVFGGDPGILVRTEGDLERALEEAGKREQMTFIEVQVDKWDAGAILREVAAAAFEKDK